MKRWIDAQLKAYDFGMATYSLLHGTVYLAILLAVFLLLAPVYVKPLALFPVWYVGYVVLRYLRMARATMLRKDREFDQAGKYTLPPEYADTESATKVRQRERIEDKNR